MCLKCIFKDFIKKHQRYSLARVLAVLVVFDPAVAQCRPISVGRLPVRDVVKWSCNLTTRECPIHNCHHDGTIARLLMECERSVEIWTKVQTIGLKIGITRRVVYGIFDSVPHNLHELYWLAVCSV